MLHTVLVGWSAWRHSPTEDEIAHLPAGLCIWNYGATHLYNVNPPLVRTLAAVPVLLTDYELDLTRYINNPAYRSEWLVGIDFIKANRPRHLWMFTLARWAVLPCSLLGLWMCWLWGRDLIGSTGGVVSATLWCFSPNVIGHGSLITPDVPAVTFGLLAAYRFRVWLTQSTMENMFFGGITLGLALLTKTYWVFLLGLWPLMAVGSFFGNPRKNGDTWQRRTLQLSLMMLIGLNVVWIGYAGRGLFVSLKEYDFYSASLAGTTRLPGVNSPENRFRETWLGELPVPLPHDYVTGIDLQKLDFERGHWSYLWGEVKDPGGWWYYYLAGLLVKVPVGVWLLVLIGVWQSFVTNGAMRLVIAALPYWLPVLGLFILASLNVKMNRHVRYVFPVLPCLFLLSGYAAQLGESMPRLRWITRGGVVLAIASSLWVYPHSLSFFNYAVGGPTYGDRYLVDSNVDWGQDNILLQDWITAHPERQPLYGEGTGYCRLQDQGVEVLRMPDTPQPGWYVVSRNRLHTPHSRTRWLLKEMPVDQVGYSYNVYHITDADTVRAEAH